MLLEKSIPLRRACEVVQIPSGEAMTLPAGMLVRITQSLGDTYTVTTDDGYMVRIAGKDGDALGKEAVQSDQPQTTAATAEELEKQIWDQLKTIYDPEIPVNVVELGLVYVCQVTPAPEDGFQVHIQMSLTAPGCGMGDVLRLDAQNKIRRLPGVKEVQVEIVMDPPWDRSRMSEAAKLQLGMFDF